MDDQYNTNEQPASEPTGSQEQEVILEWTVHLARDNPAKCLVCIGAVGLAAAAALYTIGMLAAIAVALAITASVADFVFPIRFRITKSGAECRTLLKTTEISWAKVKRCYEDDLGVKLSPLDHPSRIEAFRGVYLRFADNRNLVVDAVKKMRQP